MHRWARVTSKGDGCDVWINESHVVVLKDYDFGGCMIAFSTSEDDVAEVEQSSDYIFTEWDNWQAIQEGSD
jgi:hypothetical protein